MFVCVCVGVALVKQLFKLSNFLMCVQKHATRLTREGKMEREGKRALQNVIESNSVPLVIEFK